MTQPERLRAMQKSLSARCGVNRANPYQGEERPVFAMAVSRAGLMALSVKWTREGAYRPASPLTCAGTSRAGMHEYRFPSDFSGQKEHLLQ